MMIILEDGHKYLANHLDGKGSTILQFVNRGHGKDKEGVNNQEILRILIDRIKFMDNEVRWDGNEKILFCLRMALVLHECRHLERLLEKGEIKPESIPFGKDGHYILQK